MDTDTITNKAWPKLKDFILPAKALITSVILVMGIAMAGAGGQILIHDIIPTFFNTEQGSDEATSIEKTQGDLAPYANRGEESSDPGDLFGEISVEEDVKVNKPFYKTEQFVWILKWTHIHLFGMNMIFIFIGAITLFLDMSQRIRTWLIILPFVGVLIDITAMWLKTYVHPVFFWLHIPGGNLFGAIFIFVSMRALWEMWFSSKNNPGI